MPELQAATQAYLGYLGPQLSAGKAGQLDLNCANSRHRRLALCTAIFSKEVFIRHPKPSSWVVWLTSEAPLFGMSVWRC